MTLRTSSRTLSFRRPFVLSALDGAQPAGSYTVEEDEELLPTWSAGYRRIATRLRLPPRPGSMVLSEIALVDAAELATALASDQIGAEAASAVPSSPAAPRRDSLRRRASAALRDWRRLNSYELTWIGVLLALLAVCQLFLDG